MINEQLHRLAVPVDMISRIVNVWAYFQNRTTLVIHQSRKDANLAVVETRDTMVAAEILRAFPDVKVSSVNQPERIIRL